MRSDFKRRRSGQTLIMFTLALVPLMGMLGLVVDIGWAYFRQEAAQTAADAAANAAASAAYVAAGGGAPLCSTIGVACYSDEHPCPATITSPAADNIQAGCMYARDNGFVTTGRQTVTFQAGVGNAPISTGVTVGYWVIVRVREQIPQLFSAALGFPTATVMGRTTTGDRVGNAGGCIVALNPGASGALTMTGNTSLQSGCGVYVNSGSGSAITMGSNASITTSGSARTQIVGNWSGSGTISPAPQTGVASVGDPFSSMAAPAIGACTNNGYSLGSQQSQTISPGVYCGGITLTGHAALNFSPGLYIVKNGISMGGQTTVTGTGVTIYLDTGGIAISGGATVTLSAPSSGTWQGVQFFQNRLNTTASTFVGGTSQLINGLLYFPAANVTFTGGSGTSGTATTLVANTITMTGSSYIQSAAITHFTGNSGGVVMIE
ncbi:MAG TPA: pilus assembly protein TadG-related protein [Bryobacteraceae bacterium]|nr:pilus assembly protein TadG-related protein [Bryobacteraceae bacterium]